MKSNLHIKFKIENFQFVSQKIWAMRFQRPGQGWKNALQNQTFQWTLRCGLKTIDICCCRLWRTIWKYGNFLIMSLSNLTLVCASSLRWNDTGYVEQALVMQRISLRRGLPYPGNPYWRGRIIIMIDLPVPTSSNQRYLVQKYFLPFLQNKLS